MLLALLRTLSPDLCLLRVLHVPECPPCPPCPPCSNLISMGVASCSSSSALSVPQIYLRPRAPLPYQIHAAIRQLN